MNRADRAALGQLTLAILRQGSYVLPDGRTVDVADDIRQCSNATRVFQPRELEMLAARSPPCPDTKQAGTLEIENESTLAGISTLQREGCTSVAALNFASARNPGGGFLSGSQAQEESLARSSGLHASLMQASEFYDHHRNSPSLLYSDRLIFSPRCPVFRDDAGTLLETVHHVTFISGAAPNSSALRVRQPQELQLVPDTVRRRIEYVLALAAAHGCENLVLGAWGCGVFGNDPAQVAGAFMALLGSGRWVRRFCRVRFSVLDPSPDAEVIGPFRSAAAAASQFWGTPEA
jgi:uncharacterized protein (TIGR02452 family)